jgi:peroxiredoxin
MSLMNSRPARAEDSAPTTKSEAKKLAVGDAAPEWKDLKGADDKGHGLKDLAKAKAVVVVFTCDHCPVAKAYEGRLGEFAKEYKDKGVELVAVNVSLGEADNPEKMKGLLKEKGFNFTYLLDPSQDLGRAYGATVTPHVFVLDGKRKVAYMGAFDDEMSVKDVKKHYVRDAVDAVLAGKKPEVAVSKQFGCGITYE